MADDFSGEDSVDSTDAQLFLESIYSSFYRDYASFTLHWSLGVIFILMPIVSAMPFQVGVHHRSQTSFHSIALKVPSQYLQSAIFPLYGQGKFRSPGLATILSNS
jgi:hypothetical protein